MAVILAVGGLVVLWFTARLAEVPLVQVAELNETMNFALIHVKGEVTADPKVMFVRDAQGQDTDTARIVSFPIRDKTGEITVLAFSSVAQALWKDRGQLLPRLHDKIDVVGSVRIRTQDGITSTTLFLQTPRTIQLDRNAPPQVALADAALLLDDTVIRVTGTVVDRFTPQKGPVRLTLFDGTTELTVVAWPSIFDQIPDSTKLVGSKVGLRGVVQHYKDKYAQVQLTQPWDIEILSADPETVAAYKPNRSHQDAATTTAPLVCEEGTVKAIVGIKDKGWKILFHNSQKSEVIIWKTSWKSQTTPDQLVEVGKDVRACGKKGEYKGKGQVHLLSADGLTVLKQPTTTATGTTPPPERLKEQNPPPTATDEAPEAGTKEPASTPTHEEQPDQGDADQEEQNPPPSQPKSGHNIVGNISTLDRSWLGQEATITGVLKARPSLRGKDDRLTRFVLSDDQSEIPVVIETFEVKLDPRLWDLRKNTEIQVTGKVVEYRQKLEVHPANRTDLTVLGKGTVEDLGKVQTGAITQRDTGKLVAIKGTIKSVTKIGKGGLKLELDDGSGPILVILWKNTWKQLMKAPEAGDTLSVTGLIHDYKNDLEVIPYWPEHVRFATEGK